jgi:branched-chain amino acid:cation transporter, LIVCS family
MKKFLNSHIITTGLAIFSMFFGAGNLMYPLRVGLIAGDKHPWAIAGFIITAVLLPLAGLIAIILFQGDYKEFFYRLGRIPGFMFIFVCTTIIGPLIAMPRIVTLSYIMTEPFLPSWISLSLFSFLFLLFTFFATYKESKIVDFLGLVISPVLLVTLLIIIIKGYFFSSLVTTTAESAANMFVSSLITGYQTLDLLGGIFFSAIVITILQKNYATPGKPNFNQFAVTSLQAGLLGVSLLALVYVGLSYLGAYFGHGLEYINEGQLFSTISFQILGAQGAAIIALAVLMACYSTIIALASVYAEFIRTQLCNNKIAYAPALIITLVLTMIPSNFGLETILYFSRPIITIMYPSLIMLTLLNIAYKLFNFKPIKVPVALTFGASVVHYFI